MNKDYWLIDWLSKCYLCRLRGREADVFPVHSSIDLIDFLWHKNKSGLFYISIPAYISITAVLGLWSTRLTVFVSDISVKKHWWTLKPLTMYFGNWKKNMSFLKFMTCREFAASVNRRHPKLNKTTLEQYKIFSFTVRIKKKIFFS